MSLHTRLNTMRYLVLSLLPLAQALTLVSCALQNKYPDLPPPREVTVNYQDFDQLVIIGTNDFHGYLKPVETDLQGNKVILGGAEWFAGYVKILQEKYGDRLILLDGGDIFQGTMESNTFLGKSTMDFYNLLPYRAAAVGNHEFDYGPRKKGDPDRLSAFKDRLAESKFPFLQANIFWQKSGDLWTEKNLMPSTIIEAGRFKIGLIGLTTTSTPAKTLPQNVKELEFRDLELPTLEQAQELRAKGADLVFLVTHEGGEKKGEPIYDLLDGLPEGTIDAVVSGHAHSEVHQFVKGVPVIQSKTRGLYFGRIDLFIRKGTKKVDWQLTKIHDMHWICGTWFKTEEGCDQKGARDRLTAGKVKAEQLFPLRPASYEGVEVKPDLKVRETLAPYFARTEEKRKEKLGVAKTDFEYFPSGESQMGSLFLNASREAFPEAKVVFHNGGGVRRKFFKGPITYGDLYEVHPFDNFAVAVKMKGHQLKDLVRLGVSGANTIPVVWGVRVKYHKGDSPDYLRDVNGDGKKDTWERDRLVSLSWEKTGKPVEDNDSFWLATNDYLASGGDNTAHIFGAIPDKDRRFLDLTQRDLIAQYLRKHPKISLPPKDEPRIEAVP